MNRRDFFAGASVLPLSLRAQSENGFTPLFDGKTLNGWTIQEGPQTAFYVDDGAIVVHESSGFPTWLRSVNQYENFDFRGEFFVKGWTDSGIYIHAPEHGRPMWNGIEIHLFHQRDESPRPESMGAIFPIVPPLKVNVKNQGEWNTFRIHMEWPRLRVWTNDEVIQDLDIAGMAELRYRFRRGYLGFQSLSYPIRFRNLRIRDLPSTDTWQDLYRGPEDADRWYVAEGKPDAQFLGEVIYTDGNGFLASREKFRDFELQLYVRHAKHHNGGIIFRSTGHGAGGRRYEIQLHDVEGAHYPTGSLYSFKRASYPKIEPEVWFPFQVVVKDRTCLVRVNGDTVLEYDQLEHLEEGSIELQAHAPGTWTEFKQIKVKRI
ncbi:MAG: 3-keto-disaccharide hydrolase [Bryobacteraceae bacterium]